MYMLQYNLLYKQDDFISLYEFYIDYYDLKSIYMKKRPTFIKKRSFYYKFYKLKPTRRRFRDKLILIKKKQYKNDKTIGKIHKKSVLKDVVLNNLERPIIINIIFDNIGLLLSYKIYFCSITDMMIFKLKFPY